MAIFNNMNKDQPIPKPPINELAQCKAALDKALLDLDKTNRKLADYKMAYEQIERDYIKLDAQKKEARKERDKYLKDLMEMQDKLAVLERRANPVPGGWNNGADLDDVPRPLPGLRPARGPVPNPHHLDAFDAAALAFAAPPQPPRVVRARDLAAIAVAQAEVQRMDAQYVLAQKAALAAIQQNAPDRQELIDEYYRVNDAVRKARLNLDRVNRGEQAEYDAPLPADEVGLED